MATNVSFAGPIAGSIVTPAAQKMTLQSNYLNFHTGGVNWAQQYLPELYAQEVERYGNRSVSSFLRMVGAEMPMASDQVIWSEQGRLHIAYQATVAIASGEITNIKNIDDVSGSDVAHSLRVGNTVVATVNGVVFKAFVKSAGASPIIKPYGAANVTNVTGVSAGGASQTIKLFVYGSEFKKGADPMLESIEPKFLSLSNQPLIIKDH